MRLNSLQYLGPSTHLVTGEVNLTKTQYPASQVQDWHSHENPTLFFLLDGTFVDQSHERGSKTLKPLMGVFHPAGAIHKGDAGPSGRVGINLEPSETWVAENKKDLCLKEYGFVVDPHSRTNLLALALGTETNAESVFIEAISVFGREQSDSWLAKKADRILERSSVASVAELAALVSVHPTYLARVYRSHFGYTVSSALRRKRLLTAVRLLSDNSMNLASVAIESGYVDQAHMAKHFRQHFGLAPQFVRKRLEMYKASLPSAC